MIFVKRVMGVSVLFDMSKNSVTVAYVSLGEYTE